MFKILKKNIFRSPYQSLAAILVVSLAFFLITVFFLIGSAAKVTLNYFESRPQVIAYLRDEIKPQEIDLLRAKIESTGEIREIKYVSKDDALKIYREIFKDKPALLEMVTSKFLPASLEISANNIDSLKEIADVLKKEKMIEDIDYQEDVVSTLSKWLSSMRQFGIIIAGLLFLVSVLTILIILGMKSSQRKTEIETFKLLGASRRYINWPLYLEGIIYGEIAALISWGLSYLVILYSSGFLSSFFKGIPIFPVPFIFMLEVFGGLLVLGLIVGLLGGVLSVCRFSRSSR